MIRCQQEGEVWAAHVRLDSGAQTEILRLPTLFGPTLSYKTRARGTDGSSPADTTPGGGYPTPT